MDFFDIVTSQASIRKELNLIWMLDCSGSMKIDNMLEAINKSINKSFKDIVRISKNEELVDIKVSVIKFSDGASWYIKQGNPGESSINGLNPEGMTDMGQAFRLLKEFFLDLNSEKPLLPPIVILITDGMPTDEYEINLHGLLGTVTCKKSVKITIAVGDDIDTEVLKRFMDDPGRKLLRADNEELIEGHINWCINTLLCSIIKLPVLDNCSVKEYITPKKGGIVLMDEEYEE